MTSSTLITTTSNNIHLPSIPVFLYQHKKRDFNESIAWKHDDYHLPPILQPSPYTSPISSIASSPTPEEDEYQQSRRKGSIASLLNSDPELKLLDEEENRSNYQSHFIQNTTLKRGRPKQDQFEMVHAKKQRQYLNTHENTRAIKGLRHFSKQVCDKVAEKRITTYNEVADDLAMDIQQSMDSKQSYDQKNIRRRVYDALNVLMAMNIITKDKKVIKWLGIPDCYQQEQDESQSLLQQIEQEERRQNELLVSMDTIRNEINVQLDKYSNLHHLIGRNRSQLTTKEEAKVNLPFFLIASSEDPSHIDIQPDRQSAVIHYQQNATTKIFEDTDILTSLYH